MTLTIHIIDLPHFDLTHEITLDIQIIQIICEDRCLNLPRCFRLLGLPNKTPIYSDVRTFGKYSTPGGWRPPGCTSGYESPNFYPAILKILGLKNQSINSPNPTKMMFHCPPPRKNKGRQQPNGWNSHKKNWGGVLGRSFSFSKVDFLGFSRWFERGIFLPICSMGLEYSPIHLVEKFMGSM